MILRNYLFLNFGNPYFTSYNGAVLKITNSYFDISQHIISYCYDFSNCTFNNNFITLFKFNINLCSINYFLNSQINYKYNKKINYILIKIYLLN